MASPNISLLGAIYSGVSGIELTKQGGGTATFPWVEGSQTVTENNTYDVTNLASVVVNVSGGGVTLDPILMRPDAEKVKTYTYDKKIHADEGITIPSYTTTATVLKASANLTPTYTMSLADYNYYVVERMLTIPEYSVTTKAKGRVEYTFAASGYEIAPVEANTIHALIDTTKFVTSRSTSVYNTGNYVRIVYYSSGTAIAAYSSASYGTYQTITAPAISSSTLTLKSPAFGIRGHTTYFTNTYMNAVSDIRYQYVIEVWRVPKGNLTFNGWTIPNNTLKLLEFQNDPTHTLR